MRARRRARGAAAICESGVERHAYCGADIIILDIILRLSADQAGGPDRLDPGRLLAPYRVSAL